MCPIRETLLTGFDSPPKQADVFELMREGTLVANPFMDRLMTAFVETILFLVIV